MFAAYHSKESTFPVSDSRHKLESRHTDVHQLTAATQHCTWRCRFLTAGDSSCALPDTASSAPGARTATPGILSAPDRPRSASPGASQRPWYAKLFAPDPASKAAGGDGPRSGGGPAAAAAAGLARPPSPLDQAVATYSAQQANSAAPSDAAAPDTASAADTPTLVQPAGLPEMPADSPTQPPGGTAELQPPSPAIAAEPEPAAPASQATAAEAVPAAQQSVPPRPDGEQRSSSALYLGSALEAFMGDDDGAASVAAAASTVASPPSPQLPPPTTPWAASAAQPAVGPAPAAHAAVPKRGSYAALSDSYLGALAAQPAEPRGPGGSFGDTTAAAADGSGSPSRALGRPASFQVPWCCSLHGATQSRR